MMRKPLPADPAIIHDMSPLVELKVIETIQDGRNKKPDVYLAEIRGRPLHRQHLTSSDQALGKCILKTFPTNKTAECSFSRELAANSALVSSSTEESAQEELEALALALSQPPAGNWPHCLGWLQLPVNAIKLPGVWVDSMSGFANPNERHCKALLFEYIPNLVPLTVELLDEKLVTDTMNVLEALHEHNILHRDHINHAVWPEVSFGNLFVRQDAQTGLKVPVILDFNFATVLGNTARDQVLKKEEFERLEHYLTRGLSRLLVVDNVPKEVQRLLV